MTTAVIRSMCSISNSLIQFAWYDVAGLLLKEFGNHKKEMLKRALNVALML